MSSLGLRIGRAAEDAFDAIAVTGQNFMGGHREGPVLLHTYSDFNRVITSCRAPSDWTVTACMVYVLTIHDSRHVCTLLSLLL